LLQHQKLAKIRAEIRKKQIKRLRLIWNKPAFMQKLPNQTGKLLLSTEEELFALAVSKNHAFRKLKKIINFKKLARPLRELYSSLGPIGIDTEKGLKMLILQFWKDYSDRQMETALQENLAIKWFCLFSLTEKTPDHSYFSKLRKRIGTKRIQSIFNQINQILEQHGLFSNLFTFIDASAIITKTALWKERDKAIKKGEDKLNNLNVNQYSSDKEAKWGAKSKNKIWFGYKRHHSVDMKHGLVKKVKATPANLPDFKVLKDICPNKTSVLADKAYDCKVANQILKQRKCHNAIIKKNNNKNKNKDLDKWLTKIRMPFEGTFSKLRRRAKFRGSEKVNFQCILEAICHNLKKAVILYLLTEYHCLAD